jgi:replication factor A1
MEDLYQKVSSQISFEEFKRRVREKIEYTGGLCDERTAAMMVIYDLLYNSVTPVEAISEKSGRVCTIGRVVQTGEVRNFSRENGGEGRVVRIVFGDKTGYITAVLWNDLADLVKVGEIKLGDVIKVVGVVREGYDGLEISVSEIEKLDRIVEIKEHKISEIDEETTHVNLTARILKKDNLRNFKRSDGSEGKVLSMILGDETGKIRAVFWDENAEEADKLKEGDVVNIVNAHPRRNGGILELHVSSLSYFTKSDKKIVSENLFTPIEEVIPDTTVSIKGFVSGMGRVREFVRADGSMGRVVNIYVSDETGRVRVSLWNDHVDLLEKMDIGTPIEIINGIAKMNDNGELEIVANWRSQVII